MDKRQKVTYTEEAAGSSPVPPPGMPQGWRFLCVNGIQYIHSLAGGWYN